MKRPHWLFKILAVVSSVSLVAGLVLLRAGVLQRFEPMRLEAAASEESPVVGAAPQFQLTLPDDIDSLFADRSHSFPPRTDSSSELPLSLNSIFGNETAENGLTLKRIANAPRHPSDAPTQPTLMAGSKSGVGIVVVPAEQQAMTVMSGSKSFVIADIVDIANRQTTWRVLTNNDGVSVQTAYPVVIRGVISSSKSGIGVIPPTWFFSDDTQPEFFNSVVPLDAADDSRNVTFPGVTPVSGR